MLLEGDRVVREWVHNVKSMGAGDFLQAIADAASRADWENYPILRPVLLVFVEKYPNYKEVIHG